MSKIISKDAAGKTRPWLPPEVKDRAPKDVAQLLSSTVQQRREEVETLAAREAAQQDGFKRGYEEGQHAAREEIEQLKQRLENVLRALEKPLQAIDDQVRAELVALALAVARQILRREIKADPNHLIGLIREAVKQLPSQTQSLVIHLNPEDAETIRKTIHEVDDKQHWRVIDDPGLHQGECQIHTETSFIDAGIDALIARLSAELLGGHREADASSSESVSSNEQRRNR